MLCIKLGKNWAIGVFLHNVAWIAFIQGLTSFLEIFYICQKQCWTSLSINIIKYNCYFALELKIAERSQCFYFYVLYVLDLTLGLTNLFFPFLLKFTVFWSKDYLLFILFCIYAAHFAPIIDYIILFSNYTLCNLSQTLLTSENWSYFQNCKQLYSSIIFFYFLFLPSVLFLLHLHMEVI